MSVAVENAPRETWWVQIRGKAYGPYSAQQMRGYIGEGRVRPTSMVSQAEAGPWAEVRTVEQLIAAHNGARTLRTAEPEKPVSEHANMFVHAEINSGATMNFLAALASMGLLVDLSPGVWLLRTRHSVGQVRNALSQTLNTGDRFIVVDASRDRLAWYNLGPEVDVRIKDVWNGALPGAAAQP